MNKVLAATTLAATLLAGSALPSLADTIAFPKSGVQSYNAGSFTYNFAFSLDTTSTIDGITASASTTVGGKPNVSFSSVELFNSMGTSIFASAVSGPGFFLYPGFVADSGDYNLRLVGTVSSGKGSFNGNLTVSAVPLPSSVAMFGTALVGLAVMSGVGAKRRKASSATA